MQGEILLNLVTVLTPDDVRRMKATGLGDLAKKHIDGLDKLAAGWWRECGPIDSEVTRCLVGVAEAGEKEGGGRK
ncbi:hypothetical protein ES703_106463 [subsurface metagenome]